MKNNSLRIKKIAIYNFGLIKNFECDIGDVVLIESGINSEKIKDILYVIREFMNMGIIMREGQDLRDDFIANFRKKCTKKTVIEISFLFDKHLFCYRYFYDLDGNLQRYIVDAQSKFIMRGELCYNFINYIMNPYAMNMANISNRTEKGNLIKNIQDDFLKLWNNIKGYEPIVGIIDVFSVVKKDYDNIISVLRDKYASGMSLPCSMFCELRDDKITCYVKDSIVKNINTLNQKEKQIYDFVCYILINELMSGVSAIKDITLSDSPLIFDMGLSENMDIDEVITLIKGYLLPLERQVFIVEDEKVLKILWEDKRINSATIIKGENHNFNSMTRTIF